MLYTPRVAASLLAFGGALTRQQAGGYAKDMIRATAINSLIKLSTTRFPALTHPRVAASLLALGGACAGNNRSKNAPRLEARGACEYR